MYSQDMLITIGIACALGGIVLGLIAGRFLLRSKHAATLERELNEAQEEMKEYKGQVFAQFGDTARKFEKLNESYADLHKQLATSASVLCADMPNVPLIAGSSVPVLPTDAADVINDAADDLPANAEASVDATELEVEVEDIADAVVESSAEPSPEIEAKVEAEIEAEAASNKPTSP